MSAIKDDGTGFVCSASPRTGSLTTKTSKKSDMMPMIGVTRTPHCQVFVHNVKAAPVAYPNPLKLRMKLHAKSCRKIAQFTFIISMR